MAIDRKNFEPRHRDPRKQQELMLLKKQHPPAGPQRAEPVPHSSQQIDRSPGPAPALVSGTSPAAQPRTYSVLVADDHPVVREGLVALLNREPDIKVIAEAADGDEAVAQFVSDRPDIGLIDLRMPGMDGVQVIAAICQKIPQAKLVVVTTYPNEEEIYRTLRAGAQGYLLKDAPTRELVECVRAVAGGKTWIPPAVAAKLAKRVADEELTPRETDVLHAMTLGKSNKEIGSALNISEGTVKVHVTHILRKLKAGGRTEAIHVALRRGLVRLDATLAA